MSLVVRWTVDRCRLQHTTRNGISRNLPELCNNEPGFFKENEAKNCRIIRETLGSEIRNKCTSEDFASAWIASPRSVSDFIIFDAIFPGECAKLSLLAMLSKLRHWRPIYRKILLKILDVCRIILSLVFFSFLFYDSRLLRDT